MPAQAGFTLTEMLVSSTILLLTFTTLAGMLVHSSRINRSAQAKAELQAATRNCVSMIVQKLRSAGWDPRNAGLNVITLDTDPGDPVSEIEVFADLDENGTTNGLDEQVLIRHVGEQVLWRRTNDPDEPFAVLAANITNDADGDGEPEPMFVPYSTTAPTRITVRVTAESPALDPVTRQPVRYTIESEVALRNSL
jgi:prepilin-type N-terminal cleavage/methylation domain-containing protein